MKKYLSAAAVAKLRKPGRYAVGDGAYLQISQQKTRLGFIAISGTDAPITWGWVAIHW